MWEVIFPAVWLLLWLNSSFVSLISKWFQYFSICIISFCTCLSTFLTPSQRYFNSFANELKSDQPEGQFAWIFQMLIDPVDRTNTLLQYFMHLSYRFRGPETISFSHWTNLSSFIMVASLSSTAWMGWSLHRLFVLINKHISFPSTVFIFIQTIKMVLIDHRKEKYLLLQTLGFKYIAEFLV